MPQASRTFRIFVSSTFSDLKEERNALQERVFPRLRELCEQHGTRFQAIDLRWGVSEEAALDQQTMNICLGEIERCRKTSPRPNFIVLLGDRYGWRPLPPQIPATEFDEICKHISPAEEEQLKTWYRRDDNAAPPEYCLQPRTGEFENSDKWSAMEQALHAILERAVAEMPLDADARLKYVSSATEQEIAHGALRVADAREHVFCFFRKIKGVPQDASAKDFVDLDANHIPDDDAHAKLDELKHKLRDALPGNVKNYDAAWKDNTVTLDHIPKLCLDVWHSLRRVILAEISKIEHVDALDKEIEAHELFDADRARHFVGRADILETIVKRVQKTENNVGIVSRLFSFRRGTQEQIKTDDQHPLVVWGASGSGKSALMARAVQQTREAVQNAQVISRFIGATPDSSNGRALLASLCRQITQTYGADESTIPADYRELAVEFPKRLALATADKPLVLFLDALDQLSNADNARNLVWLPTELPEHVRIIVSTLEGECFSVLERRLAKSNLLKLEALSPMESTALLHLWLEDAGRTLQENQRQEILDKFEQCALPLFLKFAFEEAQLWRSFDDKRVLSSDIPGVIRDLFARLSAEATHGAMLVSRSLGYLAAAKNGLSENELLDVLSADKDVLQDFLRRSPNSPQVDRLPVVVWSRLYFDLEPYLSETGADGSSLLTFYHRQLRQGVNAGYLSGEDKPKRHQVLAEYFGGKPLQVERETEKIPNLRKLSEQPYQQTHGALWDELKDTLSDFDFLESKTRSFSVYDLEADYRLALSAWRGNAEDKAVVRAFEERLGLESHLINQHPDLLFPNLYNHLTWLDAPEGQIHRLCETARNKHHNWLRMVQDPRQAATVWRLEGHTSPVNAVAVTPDGQHIVTGSDDQTVKVWELASGRLVRSLEGHTSRVSAVAVTPDGEHIVSGSYDKTVKVWELVSGRLVRSLEGHMDDVNAVAVTPDGQHIVSGSDGHTSEVWELASGRLVCSLEGHTSVVNAVAVTPDGQHIVSGSQDKTVKVWELASGRQVRSLEGHTSGVSAVALTPDGQHIVSGSRGPTSSRDNTVKVWELASGRLVHSLDGHTDSVLAVAVTPDGQHIVSGSGDKTVKVWELASGRLVRSLDVHTGGMDTVAVTPEGQHIVSGSGDKTVKEWERASGRLMCSLEGHTGSIDAVAVTPDGEHIVSGSGDKSVKVWERASGRLVRSLEGHTSGVHAVAVTPDGQHIVTGSDDQTVKVWEWASGRLVRSLEGHTSGVHAVAVTPDGQHIVTGSSGHITKVWELASGGQSVHSLEEHTDDVNAVAVTPDGQHIVSRLGDKTVKVWELASGRLVRSLEGHTEGVYADVYAVAVTPDGQQIVSGSYDKTVKGWELASGRLMCSLEGHTGSIDAVVVTPDGEHIVSGSADKTVKVWERASGRLVRSLEEHTRGVNAVAVTPDGQHIISGSGDKTVKVWELATGRSNTFFVNDSAIHAVALSPDGGWLVCGDGVGRVWIFEWMK